MLGGAYLVEIVEQSEIVVVRSRRQRSGLYTLKVVSVRLSLGCIAT